MPAGFQVIGDNGNIQIDENYVNMCLVASGYTTLNSAGAATVSVNGTLPIFTIDTRNQSMAVGTAVVSGSTYTWSIGGPPNATFAWYVYDLVPNIAPAHVGLTVYNSGGRVTFSSDYEPMRLNNLVGIPSGITITPGQTLNDPPTVTLPPATTLYARAAGQKIATFFSLPKSYSLSFHMGFDTVIATQSVTVNNGVSQPYVTTEGNQGYVQTAVQQFGAYTQSTGGIMYVVDVSNYYLP